MLKSTMRAAAWVIRAALFTVLAFITVAGWIIVAAAILRGCREGF